MSVNFDLSFQANHSQVTCLIPSISPQQAGRKTSAGGGSFGRETDPTCSNRLSRLPSSKSQLPFHFLGKACYCIYRRRPCLENYWISMTELLRDYLHVRVVLCPQIPCAGFRSFIIWDQGSLAVSKCKGPSGVADWTETQNQRQMWKKETFFRERRVPFYSTGFCFSTTMYFKFHILWVQSLSMESVLKKCLMNE